MRYLVIRIGAFGDALITTPLVRYLKQQGNEIYFLGSDQSEQILRNNPNISKFILHKKDSVTNRDLAAYFEKVRVENNCDKIIDLCESLEVRLALSPDYPQWNWSKEERKNYCNLNYYEHMFTHAGINANDIKDLKAFYKPEMFFDSKEIESVEEIRKQCLGHKIIMWGLSGSGRQKTYPYVPYIVGDILREFPKVMIILVGGEACKILETAFSNHKRILKKSGELNMRQSALMSKYADLVVSPDTGFLHCSGMWETPKIGLLTHTTIENITKHFINDYSVESKAVCAPCFRLVNNAALQCPVELASNACLCMSKDAMPPETILERVKDVIGRN